MESSIGEMNEGTEKNLREIFKYTYLKQEIMHGVEEGA